MTFRQRTSTGSSTVTKENHTVLSLRQRINSVASSFKSFAVDEGDSDARSARTASAGPSSGRTQGDLIAALLGRPRTLRCAVSVAAVMVLGAVGASSAAAESAWWNITSGARPGYLHPGLAQKEVQQIRVTTEESGGHPEQARISLSVGGSVVARFATAPTVSEPACVSLLHCKPLTVAEIQAALEGPYGAGEVTVAEEAGSVGTLAFRVESTGTPATQPLEAGAVGIGMAEATELQKGRPDGEIYAVVTNIGNASVATIDSPLHITDSLPSGLRAVAIQATHTGSAAGFATRETLPCDLTTLTCTLQREEEQGFEHRFRDDLVPFSTLELRIAVDFEGPVSEPNRVSVSGGRAYRCDQVDSDTGTYVDIGCTLEIAAGGNSLPKSFERADLGPVPGATIEKGLTIKDERTPFGVETYSLRNENEGGGPATAAGSHPFQSTTTINLNQGEDLGWTGSNKPLVQPADIARDLHFQWPAGLIGNPSGLTQCTDEQFFANIGSANLCPASSAAGVAVVYINEPTILGAVSIPVPLFNLTPHYGEPARFGFFVPQGNAPVVIDTSLRSDGDYGVTVETNSITQSAGFLSSVVSVWGVPGSPAHNRQRGWSCLLESGGAPASRLSEIGLSACSASESQPGTNPPGFLFLPTSCGPESSTPVLGDSWVNPLAVFDFPTLASYQMPPLDSCNQVPFGPEIESEPTSNAATSPTGLNFDINVHDPGQEFGKNLVQSQIKKAVVTLPQGFTTNPSVAEGLKACPQSTYEHSTVDGSVACPEESKVGDVEIESPLVKQKVQGSLYVAEQTHNPNGNLLTIYLVARNPEIGVIVKQALKVIPNPVTGRLTTEVDNIPQLPFSHFQLSFRQGQRSPLITPPTCGTYTVESELYPYSAPDSPVHGESSFKITTGPEGQGCPNGTPPFHPGLEAGTISNAGGTYSPFYTHITRKDSEQEITRFSIKLPTGLLAKLKGVSECPDAAVAAAKAREVEGGATEEEAHSSCPANSEVGQTKVGTGVGNVLAYAGGRLYLAGPYHGSPISLVSVNYAKVGPFDLGTVVVRFALDVNHETAEVSVDGANSDPIPHIVDGIPIHLRDIRAYVNRPNFTLNPTSCAKKSTAATVLGSGSNFSSSADDVPVTVSSPFQAADCASLGFKPKLALSLVGKKTHRGALPAFKAVLTYPKGGAYANIAKAQVTLPKSEFLEQGHLKNVCTRKVFETGKNPGENCPANSIYGKARAVTPLLDRPLEGPVYLRTGYGTRLPELAAALNGPQISITLAGTIDSVHKKGTEGSQIRNTFALVPDAPVERFTLELKGGKKGLLVNSTDVCKGTHKALAAFTGQNGKLDEYEPALKAQCGKGKKKSGKKKSGGARQKGAR
jgi:hypothetical protein